MNTEDLTTHFLVALESRDALVVNDFLPNILAHFQSSYWLDAKGSAAIDSEVFVPIASVRLLLCILLYISNKELAIRVVRDQYDYLSLKITYDKIIPRHCAEITFDRGGLCVGLFGGEAFESEWFVCSRLSEILPMLIYCARDKALSAKFQINMHDAGGPGEASFCSNLEKAVLIPDITFIGSGAYKAERIRFRQKSVPWAKKIPVAFWRGSTTGYAPAGWRSLPRVKLCELGQGSFGNIFDCGLTAQAPPLTVFDYEEIVAAGLTKPSVSSLDFDDYRYHIDIDGNSNSWPGLFIKLLTGGPVLKIASPVGYRQWYYDRLIPWKNYVPVDSDMNDITTKLEWLIRNDDKAQSIGIAGRELAESMSIGNQCMFALKQFKENFYQIRQDGQSRMILSTCHGTHAVARQDGQLMHMPGQTAENFQSVLGREPLPSPAPGLREVEIVQGPLAPSTMVVLEDGLVAFHRDHAYLCAVPGRPELYFEAKMVGPWERFTIAETDGTAVLQNVEAKPIANAAWFENHGIDLSIASKPSLGQSFSISGTRPQEQIGFIYLEPAGRFGNNVFQLINAYWLAKSLSLKSVVLNGFHFFTENTSYGIEIKSSENFKESKKLGLKGNFYIPNGFEKFFATGMRRDKKLLEIINMLRASYSELISTPKKTKTLVLHFRSGDVFQGGGHILYVQPPASYYIKCFDHATNTSKYDSVELIYEDRGNPAIEIVEKELSKRGVKFKSGGATIKEDITRLISSECIISSCATFCESAALLSKSLRILYCFRTASSQNIWHPFSQSWVEALVVVKGVELFICDEREPLYTAPRTWVNSEDQKNSIKLYREDQLRIFKY